MLMIDSMHGVNQKGPIMSKLTSLLNKLGTIERHGAIYVAIFIFLAVLQFSMFQALLGAAIIFVIMLPHPAKKQFLDDIRFGDFEDTSKGNQ